MSLFPYPRGQPSSYRILDIVGIPYTGSYLPALIVVTDFELYIEAASCDEIESKTQVLISELEAQQTKARKILIELEKQFPGYIDKLIALQVRDKALTRQLADPGLRPIGDQEALHQRIEQHKKITLEAEKKAALDLRKSKQSKSKARKLFKKLSSLCHPDKTKGDAFLSELFVSGKLAMSLNDVATLEDRLVQAKDYLSGNARRNKRDNIRRRKQQAKDNLQNVLEKRRKFSSTLEGNTLHAADIGKDYLESSFLNTIDETVFVLEQQIRFNQKRLESLLHQRSPTRFFTQTVNR